MFQKNAARSTRPVVRSISERPVASSRLQYYMGYCIKVWKFAKKSPLENMKLFEGVPPPYLLLHDWRIEIMKHRYHVFQNLGLKRGYSKIIQRIFNKILKQTGRMFK